MEMNFEHREIWFVINWCGPCHKNCAESPTMGKHELVALGNICFLVNGFEKLKNAKHDMVAINVSVTTITMSMEKGIWGIP